MRIYYRVILMSILCIWVYLKPLNTLDAQTQITTINTNAVTLGLTTSSYTATSPSDAGGSIDATTSYTVNYGQVQNLIPTSYIAGGITYDRFVTPDTLIIRRTDAGRQLIIFYEFDNVNNTTDVITIDAEQQENEEGLYESGLLNAGYDNILVNSATNFANVERIDILYFTGIVTSSPSTAVFPVVERGGNDDIKVAAIKTIDASGNPTSYYPNVIEVNNNGTSEWGDSGIAHSSLVLRRQDANSDPLPQTTLGSQNIFGSAVSFSDFGILSNEIVYGYSIFADDVDEGSIDITDITAYPTNTGNASGLDLIAGISTAVASDDNLTRATGPGGYKEDLNTWLKANVAASVTTSTDGSTVTDWQDEWLGDHDATTLTTAPTYRDGSASTDDDINFNPTVDFLDALERGLQIANNTDFNTAASYSTKGINIAFRTGNDITVKQQIYEQGSNDRGINVYIRDGDLYVGAWNIPNTDGAGDNWGFSSVNNTTIATDTEYIITLEFNGNNTNTGTVTAYLNGQSFGIISSVGLLFADTDGIGIGDTNSQSRYDDGTTAADSFYGSIPEFIYCDTPAAFSSTQRNRIESYLAIKYGITLDQTTPVNYVASDGSIIFNTTNNATIGGYLEYNNDIAGIGRDDNSELSQTASKSENSDAVVTIDRLTDIGTDDTWLIWGNDNAALTETGILTMPDTIDSRINRVWRVAEENEIFSSSVTFDITGLGLSDDASDFGLLIAGDGTLADFSAATVVTGGTLSGNELTFTGINFSNGQYFTLGTNFMECAPGGLETRLQLWLKADDRAFNTGTTLATDGQTIRTWADASNEASTTDMSDPDDLTTFETNEVNFNPAIAFTNDALSLQGTFVSETAGLTMFAVGNVASTSIAAASLFEVSTGAERQFFIRSRYAGNTAFGTDINLDSYNLWTIDHPSGNTVDITQNSGSFESSYNASLGSSPTGTYNVVLGDDATGGNTFTGFIGELIVYEGVLTATEVQRVESYLAIKYGFSIDQTSATNYLASDGGVIWNATTNLAHNNDIAGIGRDDASCLEQKQSKSESSDGIVAIGLGSIATDNSTNANSFSTDDSFLIWGNDDASATFAGRTTGVTGTGTVTERMTRVWRADESTDVGTTGVSFDLTGLGFGTSLSDFQLIISDNLDLSASTQTPAASIDGNVVTFTGVNINDGQFFTIGTARTGCGPGGVTAALDVWLRADAGSSTTTDNTTVATWSDQSGNSNNATTDGNPPLYRDNTTDNINFNPTLEFDGTDDRLSADFTGVKGTNYTVIAVGERADANASNYIIGGADDGDNNDQILHLGYRDNTTATLAQFGNDVNVTVGAFDSPNNSPFMLFGDLSSSGHSVEETRNGGFARNSNINTTQITASNNDFIGFFRTSAFYGGKVSEVIAFSSDITGLQKQQVYTYLAIKYGITLTDDSDDDATPGEVISGLVTEGDYVASDGVTVIWDFSGNTAYHHDVAGIGRDDDGCFNQKQSTAVDTDDVLTIGLGAIATSNATNANVFEDDQDYLIWGNDDGTTAQATANTADVPTTISERMSRVWKVEDTGTVGATELQFDLTGLGYNLADASAFSLLISNTATIADAAITTGGTIDGNILSFSGVDLTNGQFFSLGTALTTCGPGGVNTNIALWLAADLEVFSDAGLTAAVDGIDVAQWNDQSSPATNASVANGGGGSIVEPTFETNEINFNPTLFLSDQNTTNNSYLQTAAATNNVSGDMTLIAVFETAQNQGANNQIENTPSLIGAEANANDNDYGLGVYQGEVVFNANTNTSFTARSTTSSFNDGEPYIATGTRVQAISGAVNLYVNSLLLGTGSSSNTALDEPSTWAIGNHDSYDNEAQFQGNISEVLVFSSVLTAEEQARAESYLALKYGITRSDDNDNDATPNEIISGSIREGDYVAADGGVIWDYSARGSTYFNDIAGIGRDDLSCLNQTRSKSENDDALVDMEISSFSTDDAWLIWGNDGAAIEATGNTELPSGITSRLNREWQVQETGTVGNISLTYDLSTVTGPSGIGTNNLTQLRLMVDTNDDFSTGVTLVSPASIDAAKNTVTFTVDFDGTDGFFYTLGSLEDNALPITLLSFSANKTDENHVLVEWSTADETNNSFFTIERSTDAINFEIVAQLDGAGNSDKFINYSYTDREPLEGVSYYRLRQTDTNGESKPFEIVRVFIEFENEAINYKAFPNPVKRGETLTIETSGRSKSSNLTYMIQSSNGTVIRRGRLANTGKQIELSTNGLNQGVYLIRLIAEDGSTSILKVILK